MLGVEDTTGLSDIIIDGGDLDEVMLDVPLPAPGSGHGSREQLMLDGTAESVAVPGPSPSCASSPRAGWPACCRTR